MLYDERDRTGVRNVAVAATALAWVGQLWLLRAPDAHVHAEGHHGLLATPDAAAAWPLMLVAMMMPVLIQPVQFVRGSGLARHRARATMLFLVGYASVWVVAGAVMVAIAGAVQSARVARALPVTAVLAVAAVWQCSPAKQICLNRCHARPSLAAFGWRADTAVLAFGATHARWCIGSCWPLMLLPSILPAWHAAAMAAASILIFCERLDRPAFPAWRWRGVGTAWRVLASQWRLAPGMPALR